MNKKGQSGILWFLGIMVILVGLFAVAWYYDERMIAYDYDCLEPFAESFCEGLNATWDGTESNYNIWCYEERFRKREAYPFTEEEKESCNCKKEKGWSFECDKGALE